MAEALHVKGGTLQKCSNLKFTSLPAMLGDPRDSKNIILITGSGNVPTLEHIEFRACNRQLEFMKLDPEVRLPDGFLINDFKFIESCWTINGFIKCSIDKPITLTNSLFENCRAGWHFVILDGGGTLQETTFTSCTGQILKMDKNKEVTVHGCEFANCTGNLIEIIQASRFDLTNCCFQGTTGGYDIKVDSGSVVCDYPLCFSRNRDASVNFTTYPDSLTALEKQFQIFGCTACGQPWPKPTQSPRPTPAPTPKPTATPEPSATGEEVEPTGGESGAKQGGLNAGGIVGILIALLICVALLVLIIILLLRRKKEKTDEPDEGEMTEETIDDTMSSLGTYDTANAKATEDNPLFAEDLVFPESQDQNYEENWL